MKIDQTYKARYWLWKPQNLLVRSDMSNRYALLGQEICNYFYEGRTL